MSQSQALNNDMLMEQVRKYAAIYDKSCKDYRDKNAKSNAWEKVR